MLANISEFDVLLERYEDEPGPCSKLLRTFAANDPKTFLGYATRAILDRPVQRNLRFITDLAITAGLIEHLLELFRQSREQAITLATKVLACNVHFDATLLEVLQRPRSSPAVEEMISHAGLDILDAISKDDRLVPGVLKLLKHTNPKVRSKAAIFVGSRTQNLAWAASRSQEDDPRVRANILESLHGLNSDFVHQMFRNSTADENNRVVGNAVLGLYLLGDAASVSLIAELANHQEARFRNTCAWLISQTRDSRFSALLSSLMKDPDEIVRRQAFKSLGEARKALKEGATRPQWKAAVLKVERKIEPSLVATVHDITGQPVRELSPTSFIVKTGVPSAFVRDYTVDEYNSSSSLSIGFVVCLPEGEEAAAEEQFTEIMQSCSILRRPKDSWAMIKIKSKASARVPSAISETSVTTHRRDSILDLNASSAPVKAAQPKRTLLEYSADQDRIDAMLRQAPVSISDLPGDKAATALLESLIWNSGRGNPHLIFLGASSNQHFAQDLFSNGSDTPATVHVLAQSSAWQTAESRSLSAATGGIYRNAANSDELQQACFEVYSSLLHHYRISWKEDTSNMGTGITLDINSEAGRGSAVYESESAADELQILPTGNVPAPACDNAFVPSLAECLA